MDLVQANAEEYGFTPHQWTYGHAIRECRVCGKREAYWDDEEYPIDPCPGESRVEGSGGGNGGREIVVDGFPYTTTAPER